MNIVQTPVNYADERLDAAFENIYESVDAKRLLGRIDLIEYPQQAVHSSRKRARRSAASATDSPPMELAAKIVSKLSDG